MLEDLIRPTSVARTDQMLATPVYDEVGQHQPAEVILYAMGFLIFSHMDPKYSPLISKFVKLLKKSVHILNNFQMVLVDMNLIAS